VILVDESSSLKNADVQAEIQAVAGLVARRELSDESLKVRIAIAGFGSGDRAVDEKCPPLVVTTKNVRDLIVCSDLVRRRTGSGQHTDFAKALTYASETFRTVGGSGVARVVILMTDGKYDPVGKRSASGLTDAQRDALDEATASLRADGAQIWPLGFGQVEKEELDDLARSGAPSTCPTGRQPYAIVAAGRSLDEYLLEILGATICKDIGGEEPIPYDYKVHPFVNEVTLTVRGASEEPSVLVTSTNKSLCVGDWKRAEDGSLACSVKVGGADTGIWKITQASTASDVAPTVETSQSGRVDLRLSSCKETSAVVSVSRIDNSAIVWNAVGGFTFPRVAIVDVSNREEIASTVLTASDRTASFARSGADSREIEVALASGQADFVWLTASVDACDVATPATATTLSSPTTTIGAVDAVDDAEPGGVPWWLIVLGLLLLAALLWFLRRRSQQSRFPAGTELRQRNVAQNPAANWNTRADLSGLREMHFSVDRNGWLVEAERDQADVIVRRLRSRTEGDFVVVQPARVGDGTAAQEGSQASHAFSVAGESGGGIPIRNTFIRIEVPEELEDEEELEE
jgi:LPXTG-motif cell wall-anchored protein